MTRFTILALTTIAALLASFDAVHAADATAQGNPPQASQIAGKSVIFRLVVDQGEAAILRRAMPSSGEMTIEEIRKALPVIADDRDLAGDFRQ